MNATRTPLTIGLAGFGTVGRSVARVLCEQRHPTLRLAAICTRRVALARAAAGWVPPGVVWTDDAETVIKTGTDVFIEVIGGIEPARTWIAGALCRACLVVQSFDTQSGARGVRAGVGCRPERHRPAPL